MIDLVSTGLWQDAHEQDLVSALHLAASRGNLECLKLLLEHSPAAVNALDSHGRTPLHSAAHAGCLEAVEELMNKYGADATRVDSQNQTALQVMEKALKESSK